MRLEGHLGADSVAELDRVAAPLRAARRPIRLDLRGLAFVDAAGLACLCRLLAEGAAVTGSSAFIAALLKECPK